jgi:hypothetical protein
MNKDATFFKRLAHEKAANGEMVYTPPAGYRFAYKDGKKTVEIDPVKKEYVLDLFHMYSTGQYSLDQLMEVLAKKHSILMARETYRRMFRNKFYLGFQTIKGEEYKHPFELFVPKYMWEKCGSILSSYRKKTVKYRGKFFLFRASIQCGRCSGHFVGERHKNINYYSCSQSKVKKSLHPDRGYLTEKKLLEMIIIVCKDLNIDTDLIFNSDLCMRLFIETAFVYLRSTGKNVEYKLHDDIKLFDFDTYLRSGGAPSKAITRRKKNVIDDPCILFCTKPRTMDEIMDAFNYSLIDAQSILLDLQLEDKIDLTSSGLWKRK